MNVCFIPISVKMEPVKIYKELTDVFVIKDLHQIPTEKSVWVREKLLMKKDFIFISRINTEKSIDFHVHV